MDSAPPQRTPLHRLHLELGARMVPFAGYDMPLHYRDGILKEHLHTRSAAGLFDVSHMGQFVVRPLSRHLEDAARAFEALVPVDLLSLPPGRQRYALFTNQAGGIIDDIMVANRGDHLSVVVNAACKVADGEHLRAHLSEICQIESLADRALLALQGPQAEDVLARLAPDVRSMRFMDVRTFRLLDATCDISRSGYTGEDGFEISIPAPSAEALARALLSEEVVAPVGLGARDSLRLEAGLCLYGSDIDTSTSPVEAGLEWAIQKSRRSGGVRAGGFPGADVILAQLESGGSRRRVGFRPEGRALVRPGTLIYREQAGDPVGSITSGGFGPSINAPIAMGYLESAHARTGARLLAQVRGKLIPVAICDLPFIPARYKRS